MQYLREFIKSYQNQNDDKFNEDLLINRFEPLHNYIIESAKTVEGLDYIKVIDWRLIEDESEFDYYQFKYKKGKKNRKTIIEYNNMNGSKITIDLEGNTFAFCNLDGYPINSHSFKVFRDEEDDYKTIPLGVSRINKLIILFKISCKGDTIIALQELFIPKPINNYYFIINGNKLCPIYQIVDNSTYNKKDNLILKTVMTPIIIKREVKTIESETHDIKEYFFYTSHLFKKQCNILLYYLATFGVAGTISYMGLSDSIYIVNTLNDLLRNYYFKIKDNLYIEVNKYMFEKDPTVRSITGMLYQTCSESIGGFDNVENIDWITKLGAVYMANVNKQYDKGKNVLISFKRILDDTTRRNLKLKSENKEDNYAVTRWMIQNFGSLKVKENLDLSNKRLRMTEYMAYIYSAKLSRGINRILNRAENRITAKSIAKAIIMRPDEIINKLQKSPLVRYDNAVNDLDIFAALKYTFKGPSGIRYYSPSI